MASRGRTTHFVIRAPVASTPPHLYPLLVVQARMYRKQAIERDNHLAGSSSGSDDGRSDNDGADVVERRLEEGVGMPDATEGYSLDVTKIFTQLKIYKNPEVRSRACVMFARMVTGFC